MAAHPIRPLKPGVFAPIPTFFLPDSEDLDIPTLQKHVVRLAQSGVGILLSGSMGECAHLSHAERTQVITASRQALDEAGLTRVPIIAGCGTGSTRESIELCCEAAQAGADYAIVIAPPYYGALLGKPSSRQALKRYFSDIAGASPIPVMLYNYPAVNQVDLDSDFIIDIARTVPNTCGIKLTCNSISKLARISSVTATPSFATSHPRTNPAAPFLALMGYADGLYPSLIGRGAGAITGLANFAPLTVAHLFDVGVKSINSSDPQLMQQAQDLQGVVGRADEALSQVGIGGTKWAITRFASSLGSYSYSAGVPRRPLPPMREEAMAGLERDLAEIVAVEKSLQSKDTGSAAAAPGAAGEPVAQAPAAAHQST